MHYGEIKLYIALSASVISPSVVKIGRWLYEQERAVRTQFVEGISVT